MYIVLSIDHTSSVLYSEAHHDVAVLHLERIVRQLLFVDQAQEELHQTLPVLMELLHVIILIIKFHVLAVRKQFVQQEVILQYVVIPTIVQNLIVNLLEVVLPVI